MSYALDRVAQEMTDELKRYKIRVPAGGRIILVADRAIQIDPYTDARKCKRILKDFVKSAKAKEAREQDAKQGRLL